MPELTDKAKEHYRAVFNILTAGAGEMSADAYAAFMHHLTEDLDGVLFQLLKGRNPLDEIQKLRQARGL